MLKRWLRRVIPLPFRNSVRLFLRRYPYSLRERYPDLEIVGLRPRDVVLDVGANIGQFAEVALAFQPRLLLHVFEPIPEAMEVLKTRLGEYDVTFNDDALGNTPGRRPFFVSRFDQASSFLEQGEILERGVYGIDYTVAKSIDVNVETIDRYAARGGVVRIRLLKLDVQGFELEVLRGAERTLSRIDWIYAEAQFEELYRSGPTANDLFVFLSRRGFDLVRMVSFRADDAGNLMECDMIFRRRRDGDVRQRTIVQEWPA